MIFNVLFAYLLGSIPFGLLLSNTFGKGNLRSTGSKNIGATNVLRTQGKLLGIATLLLDFLKGYFACIFFATIEGPLNLLIIPAPVIGHIFPVWLKFKGGKGIATFLGILCFLNFYAFCGVAATWLTVFAFTKISSISGLISVISSIFWFYWLEHNTPKIFTIILLIMLILLIIWRHKENIIRLFKKEETPLCQTSTH